MLTIDSGLQSLIAQNTGAVQTMLDTTGATAEETQTMLDGMMSAEWSDERLAALASLQEQTGAFGEAWTADEGVLPMIQQGLADTEAQAADTNFPGISAAGTTAGQEIQTKFMAPKTGVLPALEKGFGDVQSAAWTAFVSGPHSVLNALEAVRKKAKDLVTVLQEIKRLINWINAAGLPGGAGGGGETGWGWATDAQGRRLYKPKIEGEQFGGWRFPGQRPRMVGEGGPELFRPRVAGQVVSNHRMNNYNLTLNSAATSGGVIQDFALMQALYG